MFRKIWFIPFIFIASISFGAVSNITIAVVDFKANGVADNIASAVTEAFNVEIFKSGVYQVIERSQIQKIVNEQKFQMSGMTDSEYAKFGQLLGADYITVGSVSRLGEKYIINVRIVEVKTAGIIKAESGYVYKAADLDHLSRRLALKITGRDPGPDLTGQDQGGDTVPLSQALTNFPFMQEKYTRLDYSLSMIMGPSGQSLVIQSLSWNTVHKGIYTGLALGYQYQENASDTRNVSIHAAVFETRLGYNLPLGFFELSAQAGAGLSIGSLGVANLNTNLMVLGGNLSARAGGGFNLGVLSIGLFGTWLGELFMLNGSFYPLNATMLTISFGMNF